MIFPVMRQFIACGRGSIAIEFALLAPLMIMLAAGFAYLSMLALMGLSLQAAVAQTAIALGQGGTATAYDDSRVRGLICASALLPECESRLELEVSDQSALSAASSLDASLARPHLLQVSYQVPEEIETIMHLLGSELEAATLRAHAIIMLKAH
jgi:hypothetical protein